MIPSQIKVGHLTFQVQLVPLEIAEAAKAEGWSSTPSLKIYLRDDLNAQVLRDTLLHEIIHAVFYAYRFVQLMPDTKDDVEEVIAAVLPGAFIRLWQDNPELTAWLA